MSSYHLNRFLFDLKMDGEAYERATGDLERALGRYELTSEEGPRALDTNWRQTRHPASGMSS